MHQSDKGMIPIFNKKLNALTTFYYQTREQGILPFKYGIDVHKNMNDEEC